MRRIGEPDELLRGLADTVRRFEAVAHRLSPERLTSSKQGWSPNEILWHVRAAADVYGEQVTRILEEENPRWRHVSPRARMKKSRYDQVPFEESVAAFARQRAELLGRLQPLPPEAWQRAATVKVDKRPDWHLTLQERLWGMANHEAAHCAQVEEWLQD
jgi:hypothetical protein